MTAVTCEQNNPKIPNRIIKMALPQPADLLDDEIDFKKIIFILIRAWQTLLRSWKILLVLFLLGGVSVFAILFMRTRQYEASAKIYADPVIFNYNLLKQNDVMRQKVADALGVDISTIPLFLPPESSNIQNTTTTITINQDKTDKALIEILVQGENAGEAARIANAWAKAGVEYLIADYSTPLLVESQTLTVQTAAQVELNNYLSKQNLLNLSWADLQILTGIGLAGNILNLSDTTGSPTDVQAPLNLNNPSNISFAGISAETRLGIAAKMQSKLYAETVYNFARGTANSVRFNLATKPAKVFEYAVVPEIPVAQPSKLVSAAIGAFSCLILGALWLLAAAWWNENKNIINNQ
jgi:capsular polysaccharide biosynthesis protein